MENAKINILQLSILIFLFETGTSIALPLAIDAKNNAWIAILMGTIGGCILFQLYYQLFLKYPDEIPSSYFNKIIGNFFGKILSFIYIIYFIYITARILRDFGEILITFAYRQTPLFIINAMMILIVIYAVKKGIEVMARAAELNIVILSTVAFLIIILLFFTGLIDIKHLRPLFSEGLMPPLKVAVTQSIYVPFGEMVVFLFFLPYLNKTNKARKNLTISLFLSGLNLSAIMAINIAVLSAPKVAHTTFPLLVTIQQIEFADFLERLDIFFLIVIFIGAFFKISLYFYAATIGVTELFKIKERNNIVYPLGLIVLFCSLTIASSYQEHINEGLKAVPIYLHLPLQIIIPALLLSIAFFKNRHKKKKKLQSANTQSGLAETSNTD